MLKQTRYGLIASVATHIPTILINNQSLQHADTPLPTLLVGNQYNKWLLSYDGYCSRHFGRLLKFLTLMYLELY